MCQFFAQAIYLFRQNQPMKFKIWKFSPAQRNFTIKISNFMAWFWVKDKLLQQKMDTSVSCPDSEGL